MSTFPAFKTVARSLAASALSATIAFTSLGATAHPAHALDADSFGKLLFGAAAVAVVAKIYHDSRDDDRSSATTVAPVQQAASPTYGTVQSHAGAPRHARARHGAGPRPIRCARKLQTETGWVRFYSQTCLDRVGADISVPQTCLRQRWVEGRWVQFFNRRCLAKFGQVESV